MTKYFNFRFNEDFDDYQSFDGTEYPKNKIITSTVAFSTDTRWDNILFEFAKFLDHTGYVGVSEAVTNWLEGYWDKLDIEDDDEDIGNSGLSD